MTQALQTRIFARPKALASPDMLKAFRDVGTVWLGPPALDTDLFRALADEAAGQLSADSWQLTGSRAAGEIEQDNRRAHLGPVACAYLSSDAVVEWLHALTGEWLAPSWSATCYTRYVGPSEHMGEHCDKADACKYNLATYLDAHWPDGRDPSPGMRLFIFRGDNVATGLALRLTARPNRVMAIFGSRHAHLRPPLAEDERITLLAGCYRVA
jgi:hypothetical protein